MLNSHKTLMIVDIIADYPYFEHRKLATEETAKKENDEPKFK